MMKIALLLATFAAFSCAQDHKRAEAQRLPDKKRLQSVTWDLKNHKLIWIVQRGSDEQGQFVATASDTYEITPDEAVMTFAQERRGFTQEEAKSLHRLLDALSVYCAESVIWWDQGQGERLDGKPTSDPSKRKAEEKKEKVEQPRPAKPINGKQLIALLAEIQ